ncbi:MAG: winged helix DNA-binding domain-containing protein, partial [Burkholderiales bacterium]|nr:winged helix DNA-binding domain-containing protein [Opitutaceae bacterium]
RAMRERARRAGAWSGKLTAREAELAKRILAEIGERGPSGSDAVADERRAGRGVWGSATLVKATLQKLFFHGRVLIARREAGRRLYDLPERVLPAAVLARMEATAEETVRWEGLLKLRQRRLCALKRAELAAVADRVVAVRIAGAAGLVYCLREDVAALEAAGDATGAAERARLLAPLDPLIYDRGLARVLWDFEYTWEVYTPPAKRRRGYYALPLLAGAELVGHVDPKADRKGGRLAVVGREVRRGHAGAGKMATAELAVFLGLRA